MPSSRHNRADVHMNLQTLQQHTQNTLKFKLDKTLPLEMGGGYKVLLLIEKLFAIDTCWEKENPFYPMECH